MRQGFSNKILDLKKRELHKCVLRKFRMIDFQTLTDGFHPEDISELKIFHKTMSPDDLADWKVFLNLLTIKIKKLVHSQKLDFEKKAKSFHILKN